jgi:hypothetical protein
LKRIPMPTVTTRRQSNCQYRMNGRKYHIYRNIVCLFIAAFILLRGHLSVIFSAPCAFPFLPYPLIDPFFCYLYPFPFRFPICSFPFFTACFLVLFSTSSSFFSVLFFLNSIVHFFITFLWHFSSTSPFSIYSISDPCYFLRIIVAYPYPGLFLSSIFFVNIILPFILTVYLFSPFPCLLSCPRCHFSFLIYPDPLLSLSPSFVLHVIFPFFLSLTHAMFFCASSLCPFPPRLSHLPLNKNYS